MRVGFEVIADEVVGLYMAVAWPCRVGLNLFSQVIDEHPQMTNVVRIAGTPQGFEQFDVGNRFPLV